MIPFSWKHIQIDHVFARVVDDKLDNKKYPGAISFNLSPVSDMILQCDSVSLRVRAIWIREGEE
jgi:hypothetical protein